MAWSLAPSLAAARDEANIIAPDRSRISDGTIGDAAHASRKSGHNPGARDLVHALDLTHDPVNHFDCHEMTRRVIERRDPRVLLIIWNDTIWRSYSRPKTASRPYLPEWMPEEYTGTNEHRHHAHFEIFQTVTAEQDLRPWFTAPRRPIPTQPWEPLDMDIAPTAVTDTLPCTFPGCNGWWELQADGGVRTEGPHTPGQDHFRGSYFSLDPIHRNVPRVFLAITPRADIPGYVIRGNDGSFYEF